MHAKANLESVAGGLVTVCAKEIGLHTVCAKELRGDSGLTTTLNCLGSFAKFLGCTVKLDVLSPQPLGGMLGRQLSRGPIIMHLKNL